MQAVPTLLGLTLLVFVLLRSSGDPVLFAFGNPEQQLAELTETQIAALRESYGLNDPIYVQYVRYLGNILRGDFGISTVYQHQDATTLVANRLGVTAQLALAALLFAIAVGIPAGIYSAVRAGRPIDNILNATSAAFEAFPSFALGLVLMLLFAVQTPLFPVSGSGSLAHLVLPALTLGLSLAGTLQRMMRASLIPVLTSDYIRTARSKGVPEWRVIVVHGLRNALLSVVTVLGFAVPALLSGAVVTETVFAWPGLGLLFLTAMNGRDMAVVQTSVLFSATLLIITNIIVDFGYAILDPRVRYA